MVGLQPSGVSEYAAYMHIKVGKKPVKEEGEATTVSRGKKQGTAVIGSVPAI